MPEFMRSPATALIWEIWRQNRRWIWLTIGIFLFGWLVNFLLPDRYLATGPDRERLKALNSLLMSGSLLIVFGIFNTTESSTQRTSTGFPHRFFTLPVTSFRLVAVPIFLGVGSVLLVYLGWIELIFSRGETIRPEWTAILLGAFMVLYQSVLWTLAAIGALRTIVLGVIGTGFAVLRFQYSFPPDASALLSLETTWIPRVMGLALIAFLTAWMYVANQRRGGRDRREWAKMLIARITDRLPRSLQSFASPAAAQFWFEWRRSGLLLPLLIGALLVVVFGPLSWVTRNDPSSTLEILTAILVMPILLALPVGKGFSKPDFWSTDMSVPAFVAVRPLATGEWVGAKMKVAAVSAVITWLLVFAFLSLWLPFWANLEALTRVWAAFWKVYGTSVFLQYAIVALSIPVAVFMTWRFLVTGLWIGLSGNRKLYAATAAPYALAPVGLILLLLLLQPDGPIRARLGNDPDRILSLFEWIAAVAVFAKFSLAAYSWRRITAKRVRSYLLVWLGGTLCAIALALLLSTGMRPVLSGDVERLRTLLILVSLLLMPLARLGLAPDFLAKNRHG